MAASREEARDQELWRHLADTVGNLTIAPAGPCLFTSAESDRYDTV